MTRNVVPSGRFQKVGLQASLVALEFDPFNTKMKKGKRNWFVVSRIQTRFLTLQFMQEISNMNLLDKHSFTN